MTLQIGSLHKLLVAVAALEQLLLLMGALVHFHVEFAFEDFPAKATVEALDLAVLLLRTNQRRNGVVRVRGRAPQVFV